MKILVTGAAGFIGFHVVKRLVKDGFLIYCIDNLNHYYDPQLKMDRLSELGFDKDSLKYHEDFVESNKYDNCFYTTCDISDQHTLINILKGVHIDVICHLAAQAGVRTSIDHPESYIKSNIQGFANILEIARQSKVKHLVFASSSSVYGMNHKVPFSTSDRVDYPVSLYAATKKSNEVMAFSYSHLFSIPMTGLRFFTVYGPWGRPDMAYFLFTKAILSGEPIKIFNNGNMKRDFTYIDDIVEGIIKVLFKAPDANKFKETDSKAPFSLYNIGQNSPVDLMEFIKVLESELEVPAIKNFLPMQKGDVPITYADSSDMVKDFNYKPVTELQTGIKKFVDWYKSYYNQK